MARREKGTDSALKRGYVVSIDDYDPLNPRKINERATLKAMKNLCILKSELKMPKKGEIESLGDKELEDIVIEHHKKRIGRLISQIKDERNRILKQSSNPEREMKYTEESHPKNSVDMDKLLIEKIRKRQQREVEQMIATFFTLEAMQREQDMRAQMEEDRRKAIEKERREKAEEAHQRHIKHIEEMEREEQRKLREDAEIRRRQFQRERASLERQKQEHERKLQELRDAEKRRQERAEANRQHIEQIESDRQKRIREQQRLIEEREVRRLQALAEENERQHRIREAALLKRQQQIAAAKAKELALLEQKREEAEEREKLRAAQHKEFIERKRAELEKYRAEQAVKIKRNAESRVRIAQQEMERRTQKATSDEEIQRRINAVMAAREKRAEDARMSRSDAALASLRRQEAWQALTIRRDREAREALAAEEAAANAAQMEKERRLKKQMMVRRLKEEEKREAAQRLERQRQAQTENFRRRLDAAQAHADTFNAEKRAVHREREELLQRLERERMIMTDTFNEVKTTGKTDMRTLRSLAAQYGLDIRAIEARAQSRVSRSPTAINTPLPSALSTAHTTATSSPRRARSVVRRGRSP